MDVNSRVEAVARRILDGYSAAATTDFASSPANGGTTNERRLALAIASVLVNEPVQADRVIDVVDRDSVPYAEHEQIVRELVTRVATLEETLSEREAAQSENEPPEVPPAAAPKRGAQKSAEQGSSAAPSD